MLFRLSLSDVSDKTTAFNLLLHADMFSRDLVGAAQTWLLAMRGDSCRSEQASIIIKKGVNHIDLTA